MESRAMNWAPDAIHLVPTDIPIIFSKSIIASTAQFIAREPLREAFPLARVDG